MKKREDKVYLQDIIESITIIEKFINDVDESRFKSNIMVQDAVIRRFEIIGEAGSKISAALKKQNPSVEWGLMKYMRNKLIHEYFGVSPETIFHTIKTDLPPLKQKIKKILLDIK